MISTLISSSSISRKCYQHANTFVAVAATVAPAASSSVVTRKPSHATGTNNIHRTTGSHHINRRHFANSAPPPKKVTTLSLTHNAKRAGTETKKITMITAYDFPSAVHVTRANIDLILVGDSLGMVELGYETTQPVTLDQIIHHCNAVKRGVNLVINNPRDPSSEKDKEAPQEQQQIPLLVGDMPFGTYEYQNTDIALQNAYKIIKDGQMDAVKLEGGSSERCKTIKHLVSGGVAVMGHVGLLPQHISVLGGFRAQGRTAIRARQLLDEALQLQDSGVFALVLECIPSNVAQLITDELEIPTIGIGAGGYTSGQVLVYHDLLGLMTHPHHEQFVPKFCKRYTSVGHLIQEGICSFKDEVQNNTFPGEGDEYSPYKMSKKEKALLEEMLQSDTDERLIKHQSVKEKLIQTDEYEQLSLYGNISGGGSGSGSEKK